MFFRKKETGTVNRRQFYRKQASRIQPVQVKLITPSGTTEGEFLDISAHGLGARFPVESDPRLAPGDVIELLIECESKSEVKTPARVVYGQQDGDRFIRYGFEFINIGNLYSQLDSFYAKLFNRRSSLRVRPALSEKVALQLTWKGHRVEAIVSDVSTKGAGVVVPVTATYEVQGVEEVGVSFHLPGIKKEFRGHARIVSRKAVGGKVMIGLAFDLEDPDGLGATVTELEKFVEERAGEIARWDRFNA